MLLRTWRLVTLILIALAFGLALSQALQLPAKLRLDPALYLQLQQTLDRLATPVSAGVEIAAILSAILLAGFVRYRSPAFPLTLIAAACLIAAHAAGWLWIAPANAAFSAATADALPTAWEGLRRQAEYAHLARAALFFLGLAGLALSIVAEPPDRGGEGRLSSDLSQTASWSMLFRTRRQE